MTESPTSAIEEFAVGFYLLLLCGTIVGYGVIQVTTGTVIGGALVIVGLLWFTVLAAVWASLAVLTTNAYRYFHDEPPSWKAVTFASLTFLTLGVALYLFFATTLYRLWLPIGGLGFFCSLGLIISVFDGRARRVWSQHVR
jgi:hypothetical protein